jgi:hypothetical protein
MSENTAAENTEAQAVAAPTEVAAKPKKEKKAKEPKVAKEPKAEKAPVVKPAKDVKNGVNRPSTGVTKAVWDMADSLSSKAPTERAPLVEALKGKVEVGTIHTQYGRWRKYYGLTETKEQRQARLQVARDKKDAAKKAEKAIKDQKKADDAAAKAAAKAAAPAPAEGEQQPAEAAAQ